MTHGNPQERNRRTPASRAGNLRVVIACATVIVGMGGMSYAAVPLYRMFCQVTGYGGTTRQVDSASGVEVLDREITVRFDANTAPGLGWKFHPAQRSVKVRLGETRKISYFVENISDRNLAGTATYNVTPQAAGAYFNKLECFCFTRTEVKAGEVLEMPVVFFVDPDMVNYEETESVATLTLSYTFFADRDSEEAVVSKDKEDKSGLAGG